VGRGAGIIDADGNMVGGHKVGLLIPLVPLFVHRLVQVQ